MNAKLPPFIKANRDIHFRATRPTEHHVRIFTIPIVISIFFLIFVGRLFHLTVVKGTYFGYIAENNRLREIHIDGQRGAIYDRKGHMIAESILNQPDKAPEDTNETEQEKAIREKNTPIQSYTRTYSHGSAMAHVLGYRILASEKQLEADACSQPLMLNDKIGVSGVVKLYECHLRAKKGRRLIEVNSLGIAKRTISQVEPKPGQDIRLSLDGELQQRAYDVIDTNDIKTTVDVDLSEKKIAVVGLDPRTGEVLILLSYPSFDPADFENSSVSTDHYFKDESQPLFNRALLGTYPPGSVFKPVVAAGALEEGAIEENETITDNGFIQAGPIKFNNWFYTKYGKTDGEVDLRKGLQRSNDIYFYKVGEALTPEGIKKWAENFGYGKKTGIPLDEETGIIPSDFWKRETIGERWFLGDTYNLSIGQGYLLTTPMQVAQSIAPFANNGKLCTPQILRLDSPENKNLLESGQPTCKDLKLADETITAVREGMKHACDPGGTGWPFFDFRVADKTATNSATRSIEVGCKTGTAESHGFNTPPHAWFTIFAPYDDPEIVLTVMAESAGEGSDIAAPIAKEILKTYFEREE